VPIIIDFWKNEDLERLKSVLRLCQMVFVTSREVYNYLLNMKVELNVQHLALSLPDKHASHPHSTDRDIDIIQIGRRNAIFNDYMERFLKEFPATHYVYAKKVDDQLVIVSNKSGVMGVFQKREEFLSLLRRSKISLVSAPGLDEDKVRTGGFSPVTPRFLESAACGCNLLGIYPENADFDYYRIREVCVSVTNFDQFKALARKYLTSQITPDYTTFLQKNLTSTRTTELLNKLRHNG
jgi:hypothetical protein